MKQNIEEKVNKIMFEYGVKMVTEQMKLFTGGNPKVAEEKQGMATYEASCKVIDFVKEERRKAVEEFAEWYDPTSDNLMVAVESFLAQTEEDLVNKEDE